MAQLQELRAGRPGGPELDAGEREDRVVLVQNENQSTLSPVRRKCDESEHRDVMHLVTAPVGIDPVDPFLSLYGIILIESLKAIPLAGTAPQGEGMDRPGVGAGHIDFDQPD